MGKRPTIQMVAGLVGVSRGTVDRVLNNRSYVKEEVRARVLEAAAELGYLSPHAFHNQKIAGEPCTSPIKLSVPLPNWTDFFRPEVLRGIEGAREELSPFGVEIMVEECLTDNPEESIQRLDALAARGVGANAGPGGDLHGKPERSRPRAGFEGGGERAGNPFDRARSLRAEYGLIEIRVVFEKG